MRKQHRQTFCFKCDWLRWQFTPATWVAHCDRCQSVPVFVDAALKEKYKNWTQREAIKDYINKCSDGFYSTNEVANFLMKAGLVFSYKAAMCNVGTVNNALVVLGKVERVGRGRYLRVGRIKVVGVGRQAGRPRKG